MDSYYRMARASILKGKLVNNNAKLFALREAVKLLGKYIAVPCDHSAGLCVCKDRRVHELALESLNGLEIANAVPDLAVWDVATIELSRGDAVYCHKIGCPRSCDWGCNDPIGDSVAAVYNRGLDLASAGTRGAGKLPVMLVLIRACEELNLSYHYEALDGMADSIIVTTHC